MSTAGSHTRSATNGVMAHTHDVSAMTNGHAHDTRPAPPPPPPPPGSSAAPAAPALSKMKQNKRQQNVASNEASKLVAQKIAQLELDQAGEKDQELEIEKEVRKANRELHSQTAKMDSLQKIDHLSKRCTDLLHEMKRLERESQKNKKKNDQLQKERDQSRSELSKTIGLKEKLEKLCRELQKENNKLKNENRTMKANEVSNLNSWDQKYATLLQKLDDLQDEKDHPKKQVVDVELDELFRQRFKSLIEQYELRELHFHSLMRTKELEVQYNMARFEREKKRAEAEVALSRRLNEQVQTFSRTESELRNQLNLYVEKFKQKEMEEASSKTRKLEKDNDGMKRKHEAMSQNVVKMAEERAENARLLDLTKRQLEKLKSIVVMMQRQEAKVSQGDAWISDFLASNGVSIVPKSMLTADGLMLARESDPVALEADSEGADAERQVEAETVETVETAETAETAEAEGAANHVGRGRRQVGETGGDVEGGNDLSDADAVFGDDEGSPSAIEDTDQADPGPHKDKQPAQKQVQPKKKQPQKQSKAAQPPSPPLPAATAAAAAAAAASGQ